MQAPDSHKPWLDRMVSSPALRSSYLSVLVHLVLGVVLALLAIDAQLRPSPKPLVIQIGRSDSPSLETDRDDAHAVSIDALRYIKNDSSEAAASGTKPIDVPVEPIAAVEIPLSLSLELPPDAPLVAVIGPPSDLQATVASVVSAKPIVKPISTKLSSAPPQGIAAQTAGQGRSVSGVPFANRRGRSRGDAARAHGGSAASEAAVESGLAWLALHQAVDGSWQFDLSGCRCDGACRDPGSISSATASTAIALLPFLGAGNTHAEGRHQETVSRGLYFLISRMKSTPRGGDFCEGTMYGHGVTTLVLAESLGMTKDDFLVPFVRDAVRFIETSQDMYGGGWRYLPGQAGDLTVTAWQLVALKSASMAGVAASSPTIDGVCRFLDSVQTQKGAAYGYRTPAAKPCTSAIGLLCRMYTGWGEEREALGSGVTMLAKPGPSPSAIYQNFYLSQALVQLDHPVWPRWNAKNRDQIVAQQARFGHEAGSWFFADPDTAPGGRLAHTALAILTLEVYYRLLPIYQPQAVEGSD